MTLTERDGRRGSPRRVPGTVPDRPTLGSFLRSTRERTSPAAVGFPSGGRRRTPGLRREELALLAGISVDYLVRLEQDRERRPSAAVLTALSTALAMNELEHARLVTLATAAHREMRRAAPSDEPLSAAAVGLLDRLERTPGVIVDRSTNLLAWNDAYACLVQPTGLLETPGPNFARYLFCTDLARAVHADRDHLADIVVSHLQSSAAEGAVDDGFDELVRELRSRSADFDVRWVRQRVVDTGSRRARLVHPSCGVLDFVVECLVLPSRAGRWLLTYVPADDVTEAALGDLVGERRGEGRLRAV